MGLGFEISKLVLAFLVLINPFAALSVFLDLTRNYSSRERRKVAQLSCLSVFIVIVLFALSGNMLLRALGISTGSFQVGGGILVFIIALSLMSGNDNPAKPDLDTQSEHLIQASRKSVGAVAVVPLAIPMMIGPGGISTVVIYASSAKDYADVLSIIAAGLIISLICYTMLIAAVRISRFLGETGLTILNRIMGMMLAAVSVEIIVAGLKNLFPQLAG